jgi:serine/threonine protein kinase
VELFAGREADESKRIEMIVDLAEFLRNRGDASPSHDGFGAGSSKPEPVRPRFEVVRHLASGGLGQVSVAIDHELKREVALKQILGRHADDPSRAIGSRLRPRSPAASNIQGSSRSTAWATRRTVALTMRCG